MKNAEIIAQSLKHVHESDSETTLWTGPEASYEAYLAIALERIFAHLPEDADVPTCADLTERWIECCPTCHGDYPDELELVEFEPGKHAWVCCAIERAL
jgi:hypothetical protein